MPTLTQFLTLALKEIRVARAGDVPSPDDMADALLIFNELLDEWNADARAAYTQTFGDFTLVPNLNPHLIGPAGSAAGNTDPTFVVPTARPTKIIAAQLNLGGGAPQPYVPIAVIDDAEYRRLTVPGLQQILPTQVYYSADWIDPNNTGTGYGQLYFWGVPQSAYTVRLWYEFLLAQITDLTLNCSWPVGYQAALRLTLAERLAPMFGQIIAPQTAESARLARERVFGNNDDDPRIATADAGLGGGGHPLGFNYASRTWNT